MGQDPAPNLAALIICPRSWMKQRGTQSGFMRWVLAYRFT